MSEEKQRAVLGHALTDRFFYEQCSVWGVAPNWFNLDHMMAGIWKALAIFVRAHNRHPSLAEVLELAQSDKGKEYVERFKADVRKAVICSKQIGTDLLIPELRFWAASSKIIESFNPGSPFEVAFNSHKDIPKSIELLLQTGRELNRIIDVGNTTNQFLPSPERIAAEAEERQLQAVKMLPYGIPFLDDALGGIMPNDLILIGSKTGAGKTQICSNIAAFLCAQGKRVAFFALEAEDREIERRMKYGILAELYYGDIRAGKITKKANISYKEWRQFRLQEVLGKYEAEADARFSELKNLQTFYRSYGDFNVDDLEREIAKVAKEVDLIILDHVHYVDVKSDQNENAEMKVIVKKLRDLALSYSVPIIAVAHLRKDFGGKNHPLVPSLEDFHGSSDLVKICTAAIVLAPAYDLKYFDPGSKEILSPDHKMSDTYITVRKSRLAGGDVTRHTGVAMFNRELNTYWHTYAIGRLVNGDREWQPYDSESVSNKPPYWAVRGTIRNILATDET